MYFDTTKIAEDQWVQILEDYRNGASFRDIEKKYGIHRKMIARKVNDLHLKRNTSDQRTLQHIIHRQYDDIEILNLFNNGLNLKQISVKLKISGPTVRTSLLRSGILDIRRKKVTEKAPKIKLSRIKTINQKNYKNPLKDINFEQLFQSYIIDKNNIKQTAVLLGVGYGRIKNKLEEYNILRSGEERRQVATSHLDKNNDRAKKLKKLSKDLLEELYLDKKLCAREIGEMYDVTPVAILSRLRKFSIPIRTKSEAFKISKNKIDAIWPNLKNQKSFNTRPERCFIDWATKNSIEIESQFMIGGRGHRYDFKIKDKKLIIEIDGDYWHSSKEQQNRDKRFDSYANSNGFIVLRFLASLIYKSDSKCFDIIIPILQEDKP